MGQRREDALKDLHIQDGAVWGRDGSVLTRINSVTYAIALPVFFGASCNLHVQINLDTLGLLDARPL
jgi:hypothetical protein